MPFWAFIFYKGDQTAPKAKQDFKTMIKADPGVVIDVRTKAEWDGGHIERAINSDWTNGDFQKWQKQWTNPRPIIYIVQQEEEAERQWII